ncbi:hypothetical protein A6302_03005 [Methylobrevis pamukkalensis]|uniref:Uncharacterized protein n=1 Tax=Methylobrevis pamukkalensis TaxID=1439726 RepID=A0A1E3H094_9HYPH|nr:hypothetical protein A6302_03005 [Methylobrevis pamukkalensis]
MGGIAKVAAGLQRVPRRAERRHRPAEIALDESDLGLGNDAAGAGGGLALAEGFCGGAQQVAGAGKIAELRHGDAAQRQRRRIVAQRHMLQGHQRVPRRQRPCGSRDQRVHRNPVTLVTPGRSRGDLGLVRPQQPHGDNRSDAGK